MDDFIKTMIMEQLSGHTGTQEAYKSPADAVAAIKEHLATVFSKITAPYNPPFKLPDSEDPFKKWPKPEITCRDSTSIC